MAIIKIPSKKIYDNPKHGLSKNYINKVEAKENKLDFIKDFNSVVGTYKKDISELYKSYTMFTASDFGGNIAGTGSTSIYGEMRKTPTYTMTFNRTSENGKKNVASLSSEQKGASVYAKKTTKTYSFVEGEYEYRPTDSTGVPKEDEVLSKFPTKEPSIIEEDVYEIPQTYEYGTASIDWGNYQTYSSKIEGDLIKGEISNYRAYANIRACQVWNDKTDGEQWIMEIVYIEYIPKELTFSVYGDTEEYKVASNNRSYGTGNDYFKMSTNELMQETAELDEVPVVEANANAIIREYKNGKETYELFCSVGDYYDIFDNMAVSTTKLIGDKTKIIFDIGDIVIPYKPSASGDKAISYMKNGKTPKSFKVVGNTPLFDGAVWQLLNLLEEVGYSEGKVITTEVKEEAHTMIFLKPIHFKSINNGFGSLELPNDVESIYYEGIEIPEVEYIDDGVIIKKVYFDEDNWFELTAGITNGNKLSVISTSYTTEFEVTGSGLSIKYSGTTKAVPPQDLVFELYMS